MSKASSAPRLPSVDHLLNRFMESHNVLGAAVAVARRGRLVHAAGYGRTSEAGGRPVVATDRFRIASVSKPVTAIAILRLWQEDRLRLDDAVADILELEPVDPRFRSITVEHLLHHTAGFDSAKSLDPMFADVRIAGEQNVPLPIDQPTIVRFMLRQPLDFAPGTRYAYSNFGYLLLGQVIQRVTDMAYDDYVRQHILAPLGIESMQLGRTAREHAARDEVRYLADHPERRYPSVLSPRRQQVQGPYGNFHLEPMAAHGGWIASAPDLVRLATALEGHSPTELLSPAALERLRRRPACSREGQPVYYGAGVQVRVVAPGTYNLWHNGSLDGTNSLWVLRHDDMAWTVLFNQRYGRNRKPLSGLIDGPLHGAVDQAAVAN
ncbi:serine hydrolase domain-containing protein [Roseimaritima sediminicola]|uniref:serine hydrolase domain-containing protein n=1 Tax=Roseimaritima sediminicola TaxID=2662066 RepID=UPI0013873285|nr:serine hydrolase domain-containing protein [Roseimaritima sediminicola]